MRVNRRWRPVLIAMVVLGFSVGCMSGIGAGGGSAVPVVTGCVDFGLADAQIAALFTTARTAREQGQSQSDQVQTLPGTTCPDFGCPSDSDCFATCAACVTEIISAVY